jgi:hypothetical protein
VISRIAPTTKLNAMFEARNANRLSDVPNRTVLTKPDSRNSPPSPIEMFDAV